MRNTVESKDKAAELALFLLKHTGSIFGVFRGKLTAVEQCALFGKAIGKGTIIINGEEETICNRVKVCFGLDYDDRNVTAWRSL